MGSRKPVRAFHIAPRHQIKQKETKVTEFFFEWPAHLRRTCQAQSPEPKNPFVFLHPLYQRAERLSGEVIGAAIEVHRHMGSGLIESVYERCMLRELELRSIPAATQQLVRIEYKGLVFDESLRFDIMVENCLLLELKAVETLHPFSKAQLFSYMKLLDIPIGLLINFHEPVLKNGISRMILPGANRTEGNEGNEVSLN